jgi:hypothetical protein
MDFMCEAFEPFSCDAADHDRKCLDHNIFQFSNQTKQTSAGGELIEIEFTFPFNSPIKEATVICPTFPSLNSGFDTLISEPSAALF